MLKKIYLFSLILVSTSFVSQTLYSPSIPASGVTYPVSVKSDTTSFSQQGPWDFSSTSTTSTENIRILPISTSPIASNYPNASHVKYEGGEQFFIGFDSNAYTFHGEVTVLTSSYSSPLTIHPYPFSKGDIHTDSKLNIPFTVPGGPPFLERNDQVVSRALDTGVVTMPDGTIHNNALLVRSTRTFTDRQTGSPPCITTLDQYHWWIMGYAIPVVQISTLSQAGACPPSIPVKRSKFLIGNPFANVENINDVKINIFPNPTSGLLNIEFDNVDNKFSSISVLNVLGDKIYNDNLENETIRYSSQIDVSSYSNGIYFVRLTTKDGFVTKKIILQ
jgi:hypothetical protein